MTYIPLSLEARSIISVICCIAVCIMAFLLGRTKAQSDRYKLEAMKMSHQMEMMTTDYSDRVLTFIRTFTSQVTVLLYREFIDSHDVDKINKAQIEKLVSDISQRIRESVNFKNIEFERTLFTLDFLEMYIIQTVIMNVKQLWDKSLANENI